MNILVKLNITLRKRNTSVSKPIYAVCEFLPRCSNTQRCAGLAKLYTTGTIVQPSGHWSTTPTKARLYRSVDFSATFISLALRNPNQEYLRRPGPLRWPSLHPSVLRCPCASLSALPALSPADCLVRFRGMPGRA